MTYLRFRRFLTVFVCLAVLCTKAFGETGQEIVQTLFGDTSRSPDLIALDEKTGAEIERRLSALKPSKRKIIAEHLLNANTWREATVLHGHLTGAAVDVVLGPSYWNPLVLQLSIPQANLRHPFGRLMLIHEMQHLENLAKRGDVRDVIGTAWKILAKQGLTKEEASAHEAEYEYIHNAFTPEDIENTRNRYSTAGIDAATPELQQLGAMNEVGELSLGSEKFAALSPEERQRAEFLLETNMASLRNRGFLRRLDRAMKLPKEEYVSYYVAKYQAQQAFLDKVRRIGLACAAAGACTCAGIYQLVVGF